MGTEMLVFGSEYKSVKEFILEGFNIFSSFLSDDGASNDVMLLLLVGLVLPYLFQTRETLEIHYTSSEQVNTVAMITALGIIARQRLIN